MPFGPEQIESAAPGAWSGKPGSLIYEDGPAAVARVLSRGATALPAAGLDDQQAALARATDLVENTIHGRFRGLPIGAGQRLLFPATGAVDWRRRLIEGAPPDDYLLAIALIAEEIADGVSVDSITDRNRIASEGSARGSVTYRAGAAGGVVAGISPEAYQLAIRALPPRMI